MNTAGLLADPAEVRAILIASARAAQAITYAEVLELLGHHFSRPKMRALCTVLGFVDDEAAALGGEDQPLAYGDDPKRDMAGVFERVGPFRWRLVIPWPQSTSKLDVFELTPVAQQPQG